MPKDILFPDLVNFGYWNVKDSGSNDTQQALEIIANVISGYSNPLLGKPRFNDAFALVEIVGKKWYDDFFKVLEQKGIPYNEIHLYSGYKQGYMIAEYYTLFFNPERTKIIHYQLYPDKKDDFTRPPMLVYLESGKHPLRWKGTLIIFHASASEKAKKQLKVLASNVIEYAKKKYENPNVVIMADLNLVPPYIDLRNREIKFSMREPVDFPGNSYDTTVFGKTGPEGAIDHIIWDAQETTAWNYEVGSFGLPALQELWGKINPQVYNKRMLQVSDHWPLFISFCQQNLFKKYPYYADDIANFLREQYAYLRGIKPLKLPSLYNFY
ncbi:MAG: hypothetical protein QXR96_00320 [Candidatus Woesearchaeota archaeon]